MADYISSTRAALQRLANVVKGKVTEGDPDFIGSYRTTAGEVTPGTPSPAASLPYGMRQQAAQSIPHQTWTTIEWSTPVVLSGGVTFNETTKELVVAKAGLYLINGNIQWPANQSTGRRIMRFVKNGLTTNEFLIGQYELPSASTISFPNINGAKAVYLNAGDGISIGAYQSSGATISTYTAAFQTCFDLTYQGS